MLVGGVVRGGNFIYIRIRNIYIVYEYRIRMDKAHVNLSIDKELLDKSKQLGINMSALLEKSIKERQGLKEVNIPIDDGDKCQRCGKAEQKATREHLNGLTWLCPDEIWICDECLKREVRKIIIAQ